MKKLYFFLALTACLYLSHRACPEVGENSLSFLLESNFFIPKESSVCVFRKTEDALGSGEGWMYGEDDKYYYRTNIASESKYDPGYYILKKGEESKNFNKLDSETWDNKVGVRWLPEKLRWDDFIVDCE